MLTGFETETRIFGQHGRGISVSIDVRVDPINSAVWFVVKARRVAMYTGLSLDEAIELYNSILQQQKEKII